MLGLLNFLSLRGLSRSRCGKETPSLANNAQAEPSVTLPIPPRLLLFLAHGNHVHRTSAGLNSRYTRRVRSLCNSDQCLIKARNSTGKHETHYCCSGYWYCSCCDSPRDSCCYCCSNRRRAKHDDHNLGSALRPYF